MAPNPNLAFLQGSLKALLGSETKLLDLMVKKLNSDSPTPITARDVFNVVYERASGSSPEAIKKVELLSSYYELTGCDGPLTAYLSANNPKSLSDLAKRFYTLPADAPADIAESARATWKQNIFSHQPSAVLLGLVDTDVIPAADDNGKIGSVKTLVVDCLTAAVGQDFDISKKSVRILFKHPEVATKLSNAPKDHHGNAMAFIRTLQRLQALVRDPADIAKLMAQRAESAHDIAVADLELFIKNMAKSGMPEDTARRIHDHATTVEIRNEQTWAMELRRRNAAVLPKVTDDKETRLAAAKKKDKRPESQVINMTNLFDDMDGVECSDCSSVLSASAYFVDLLRLLQETRSIPDDSSSPTLFDTFMDRRPDLQYLELSCTNTNVLIPYLDLVNEILESWVDYVSGNKDAKDGVKNMSAEETNDPTNHVVQPRHIDLKVYQGILQKQVFPLNVFPYNQAIDTIRSLLTAAGSSRREVLSTFSSVDRFLTRIAPSSKRKLTVTDIDRLRDPAQKVLDRANAAEILGLQQEDFMAITREAFPPFEFWRSYELSGLASDYRAAMGIRSAMALWGYDDDTLDMAGNKSRMLDEIEGVGLTFIKRELLPRAAISFKDLQDILKTQFMGGRLVITTNQLNRFSGKLDDMRLRCTVLLRVDRGTLTEDICHDLQAFIRLWKKLGWSIGETDAILSTLRRNGKDESTLDITPSWGITGEMLEDIAAVKQITEIPGIPYPAAATLQPLWGNIDTNGPTSLYARLFLQARIVKLDNVFTPDEKTGRVFTGATQRFSQHKPVVLATLGILEEDLSYFLATAGPSPEAKLTIESPMTLESVSAIYRVSLMCNILGIAASEYAAFQELFSTEDIFANPRATLQVLRKWKLLLDAGWTLKSLVALGGQLSDRDTSLALEATKRLMDGIISIEKSYPSSASHTAATAEEVVKVASLLFPPGKSEAAVQMIEGVYKVSRDLTVKESAIPDKGNKTLLRLASKLSCNVFSVGIAGESKISLTLTGLLSKEEKKMALEVMGGEVAGWSKAIEGLDSDSRAVFKVLSERIFTDETVLREAEEVFPRATDEAINNRRLFFLRHATPILKAQCLQQIILDNVSVDFPVDSALLMGLLTDIVRAGSDKKTALEALRTLPAIDGSALSFDGIFLPPTSGDYYFIVEPSAETSSTLDDSPPLTLLLDAESLNPTLKSGRWESDKVRLTYGKTCTLTYKGINLKQIQYMTKDALTPSPLTADMLIEKNTRNTVDEVYRKLAVASKVLQVYRLNLKEMEYFHRESSKSELSKLCVTFHRPTIDQLQRLQTYRDVRDACQSKEKKDMSLIELFEWTVREDAYTKGGELYTKISEATGWPTRSVESILLSKYPNQSKSNPERIINLFRNEGELFVMKQMFKVIDRMNLPSIQVITLFRFASPDLSVAESQVTSLSKDETFISANDLRLATHSTLGAGAGSPLAVAHDELRDRQRTALVQFLLHHKKIKELKLLDADHLFEFFLIDVQMGAKLQTSRMKQAISTVQLFIQRCNLGLEKSVKEGVMCAGVSQVRWKYMAKYTLWEANRKLFLYPENWIDPTLRDNKSDLFKTLEASIMQSNVDMETISNAIKAYVYGVNEIASLEVQAYVWQKIDEKTKWKFHFFGRTRNAPYQYYYRSLDVDNGKSRTMHWDAWTKIDVDIPSLETDIDGKSLRMPGAYLIPVISRGRLFLYMPHFMLQSQSDRAQSVSESGQKVTFKEIGNQPAVDATPKKHWEIRLGHTEFRNGKWSAKRISQRFLQVPLHRGGDESPPLSSFRFFVDTISSKTLKHESSDTDDVIVIDVESWHTMKGTKFTVPTERLAAGQKAHRWVLGRFKIRGTQVSVIEPSTEKEEQEAAAARKKQETGDPEKNAMQKEQIIDEKLADSLEVASSQSEYDHSFPTHFSKLWAPAGSEKNPEVFVEMRRGADISDVTLAMTTVNELTYRDFTWTMSYHGSRSEKLTALLLEVSNRSSHSTYFALPPAPGEVVDMGPSAIMGPNGVPVPVSHVMKDISLFDHVLAADLMEYSTTSDTVDEMYDFLSKVTEGSLCKAGFGGITNGYDEHASPYALYNWELGMHVVSLLMERLLATQQFELALKIARLVFDPTIDGKGMERCWRFVPFRNTAITGGQTSVKILNSLLPEDGKERESETYVRNWKKNPFIPHAIARSLPVVYMKRFVMKYIEILIASGDEYFRQNSLESIPLAIQRYVEASHLFGPPPQQIPSMGKRDVKTFKKLDLYFDIFSNAAVDMELEFPYSSEPCYRGAANGTPAMASGAGQQNLFTGIVKTGYFCVPPNTQLTALRNLINDRFYKVRNCMDINGRPLSLPLFDPPIEPGLLSQAQAAGLSPSALLNDLDAPMPNYRFYYLLQKALEMCSELRGMGEQFLAAKEKKDSEGLTMLLSRYDVLTNTTLLPIKQQQKTEVLKSIEALEEVRRSHVSRLRFYLALIGESSEKVPDQNSEWTDVVQSIEKPTMDDLRMTSYEKLDMEKQDSAARLTDVASVLDLTAAGLLALPNLESNMQPMGVGVGIKFDAANAAEAMIGTAKVLKVKAQMDSHEGQRASRKGQMIRQLQERRLQANMAGHDVKHMDKEIAVHKVKLAICESEIRAQEIQIERSSQVQEWHRTKYTNEKLYAWLENSFRKLYYESYLLTVQLARKAERAFFFENASRGGPETVSYLTQSGYWDSARDGLLSSQNLYLSLKRLEMAYMEKRAHDFEIVKNISLRQTNPTALLALRHNGSAQFWLPEVLFDLDFPGHYFRRIKSVSVSIPCIVGPYTSLNCTLSLLENRTRISPSTSPPYADKGRDDPRFRTDRIPITSIAVSSGQNDSGTFELNFSGERYLPFEGAGAISRWKLEFPATFKQFDYSSISDVVIQMRYTSIDGGIGTQQAATGAVQEYMQRVEDVGVSDARGESGCYALLDLRNDYPNEWFDMRAPGSGRKMKLDRIGDRLPFWTKVASSVTATSILLVVRQVPEKWSKTVSIKTNTATVEFETAGDVDMGKDVTVLASKPFSGEALGGMKPWELTIGTDKDEVDNVYLVVKYRIEIRK